MLVVALIVIAVGVDSVAADRYGWGLFGIIGGLLLAGAAVITHRNSHGTHR